MRLSNYEKNVIKTSINKHDPEAAVYLFGSRTDDTKKGGDIDILVLSKKINPDDKIDIKVDIFEKLEEQKIDIILAKDSKRPFVKLAMEQGILL
ncbi:MAG: nucleotidyltransferase domain-containing protein [Candidatus Aminicenantes bacterium]|nr:MAG: nucleotidyltransferase domain-containing protein [Candidatus Aminicenantes bacterium]